MVGCRLHPDGTAATLCQVVLARVWQLFLVAVLILLVAGRCERFFVVGVQPP